VNEVVKIKRSNLVLGVPVLEPVIGGDSMQIVRVPADDLRTSLRIMPPLSVTLHIENGK
jgi:hypothetical protein